MTHPPKSRIRLSFERAATSYDSAAQVQRHICEALAGRLPALSPRRILDAGCGTGYGLRLLQERFPESAWIAGDISRAMLDHVPHFALRIAADLERFPLAARSIELYWSSLAWQWCDLPSALAEARRLLAPGGCLAVATLGPATFHELRQAFAGRDSYAHTLAFVPGETLLTEAQQQGFANARIAVERVVCHYGDLKSLLRSVKAIGANQVGSGRRPGLMGRAAWQSVEAAYESLREPAGLPLTYEVLYLTAHE